MSRGIFVTATGTDAGKTFVSALIVKKLREAGFHAGYYKAALSGAMQSEAGLIPGDADYVRGVAGLEMKAEELVSYVYETPVSPHLAAKLEGNPPEMNVIMKDYMDISAGYDFVTVEGSGGIVCPIRFDHKRIMLEDIIKEMNLSALVVADAGLGTINATVLTVAYMKQKNIPVKGIILNRFHEGDVMEEDNRRMVEILTGIPVIATVDEGALEIGIDEASLARLYG